MYNIRGDKMINTEIIIKTYELKDKILNSKEYKEVKEKEKEMEDNCSLLLIKYNRLFNEYNEAIRFKDYGSDVNKAQKELANCKKELDENNYVKEYRNSFKKMNKILKDIEKELFNELISKRNIEID